MVTFDKVTVVVVVFRLQSLLKVGNGGGYCDPSLGLGDSNRLGRDSGADQPALDRRDGLVSRGKHVDNLSLGQVLAVVLGSRVRAKIM